MAEDTNEGDDEHVVDEDGEAVVEAEATEAGEDATGEGSPGNATGDDATGDVGVGDDDAGDGPGFDFETEVQEPDGVDDELEATLEGGGDAVDDEADGEGDEDARADLADAEATAESGAGATTDDEAAGDGPPTSSAAGDEPEETDSGRSRGKSLAELDRELEEMDVGPEGGETGAAASVPEPGPAAGSGQDAEGDVGPESDVEARAVPEPDAESTADAADERYCSNCGSALAAGAEICPECGVRVAAPEEGDEKDPGIAALLSFLIPGLGNIYDEDMERGLAILVAWVVWLGFGWFFGGLILIPVIGGLTLGLGLLLWLLLPLAELVVHVAAAYDAYNRAS